MPPFTDGNFEETKWYPVRTKAICSLLTSRENTDDAIKESGSNPFVIANSQGEYGLSDAAHSHQSC
jgi:hypothetical protein